MDLPVCGRGSFEGYCFAEDISTTTTMLDGSSTTTTVSDEICPSALVYGEHSTETELLRYIRDNILAQTLEGQEIIRPYYQWSPAIVDAMGKDAGFNEEINEMIDGVLEMIEEAK